MISVCGKMWKDVDEFTGWGRCNLYRVRNSWDLEAGHLCHFVWLRDDICVEEINQ